MPKIKTHALLRARQGSQPRNRQTMKCGVGQGTVAPTLGGITCRVCFIKSAQEISKVSRAEARRMWTAKVRERVAARNEGEV